MKTFSIKRFRKPRNIAKGTRGIYVALASVLIIAVIALCAMILGLGFLASGSSQLQNINNFVALAAIEEYVRKAQDPTATTYISRANYALQRANYILNKNRVIGTDPSKVLGSLSFPGSGTAGGVLTLGTWYTTRPSSGPDFCTNLHPTKAEPYPCFVPAPTPAAGVPFPTEPINAARISVVSDSSNPLIAPLGKLLGNDRFNLSSESTATVVQRCTVLLLDTSVSTTADSHTINNLDFLPLALAQSEATRLGASWPASLVPPPTSAPPQFHVLWPPNPGLFAYKTDNIPPFRGSTSSPPLNCGADDLCDCSELETYNKSRETMIWCQYAKDAKYTDRFNAGLGDPNDPAHYWSDYQGAGASKGSYIDVPSKYGMVRVDRYTSPEPLQTYLLGFNAALRTLQVQESAGDKVALMAFTGTIRDRVPASGMTADLNLLIQQTNADNIGRKGFDDQGLGFITPEIHPNFIDRGWFPLDSTNPVEAGTNLQIAFHEAINALSDPLQCPATARKAIIIATDGIATCHVDNVTNNNPYSNPPTCGTDLPIFNMSRQNLIGEPGSALHQRTILARLISGKIAVTALIAGDQAGPNYIDRFVNGRFIDFAEAQSMGYGQGPLGMGGFPPAANHFFMGAPLLAGNLPCHYTDPCPYAPPGTVNLGYACRRCVCQTATMNDSNNPRPGFCFPNNWGSTYAYHRAGLPGVKFRTGNAVLGRIAFETGGTVCPLVPKHPNPNAYCTNPSNPNGPKILCDAMRVDGQAQNYALEDLTKAEIAAKCAQLTVGGSPFTLVSEY